MGQPAQRGLWLARPGLRGVRKGGTGGGREATHAQAGAALFFFRRLPDRAARAAPDARSLNSASLVSLRPSPHARPPRRGSPPPPPFRGTHRPAGDPASRGGSSQGERHGVVRCVGAAKEKKSVGRGRRSRPCFHSRGRRRRQAQSAHRARLPPNAAPSAPAHHLLYPWRVGWPLGQPLPHCRRARHPQHPPGPATTPPPGPRHPARRAPCRPRPHRAGRRGCGGHPLFRRHRLHGFRVRGHAGVDPAGAGA